MHAVNIHVLCDSRWWWKTSRLSNAMPRTVLVLPCPPRAVIAIPILVTLPVLCVLIPGMHCRKLLIGLDGLAHDQMINTATIMRI